MLSPEIRSHLASVAAGGGSSDEQPIVFESDARRMAMTPGYTRDALADNVQIFHGREVRQFGAAAGGMGMAIHLSLANGKDPEGWTEGELAGYDGWGHDSGRVWRTGDMLTSEGYKAFKSSFGDAAYTLHHRFYLHLDPKNQLWLSAEDGCEGYPAPAPGASKRLLGLFG